MGGAAKACDRALPPQRRLAPRRRLTRKIWGPPPQASQSFTDGNIDFEWRRGAVMTAKEDELWKPAKWATEEDIGHMKNRVLVFMARARIPRITDTHKCARCMCRWIRDAASAADCDVGLRAPLAPPAPSSSAAPGVCGLGALCAAARLPEDASSALLVDLLAMGAVDVRELGGREWQSLAAWARLKPLERRRLESVLQEGAGLPALSA